MNKTKEQLEGVVNLVKKSMVTTHKEKLDMMAWTEKKVVGGGLVQRKVILLSDAHAIIEHACKEQGHCSNCANRKSCEMWKIWKHDQHIYFDKGEYDFRCNHFELES